MVVSQPRIIPPPHSAAWEADGPVWPVSVPGSDLGALAPGQIGRRLGMIDRGRGAGAHPTTFTSKYLTGAAP